MSDDDYGDDAVRALRQISPVSWLRPEELAVELAAAVDDVCGLAGITEAEIQEGLQGVQLVASVVIGTEHELVYRRSLYVSIEVFQRRPWAAGVAEAIDRMDVARGRLLEKLMARDDDYYTISFPLMPGEEHRSAGEIRLKYCMLEVLARIRGGISPVELADLGLEDAWPVISGWVDRTRNPS